MARFSVFVAICVSLVCAAAVSGATAAAAAAAARRRHASEYLVVAATAARAHDSSALPHDASAMVYDAAAQKFRRAAAALQLDAEASRVVEYEDAHYVVTRGTGELASKLVVYAYDTSVSASSSAALRALHTPSTTAAATTAAAPAARREFAAAVVRGVLYVFGGVREGETGASDDTLYAMDLRSGVWRRLAAGPSARAGAALFAVRDDALFAFGGDAAATASELWSYDVAYGTWSLVGSAASAAAAGVTWPRGVRGAAVRVVAHEAVFFGGRDAASGAYASDVWSLHALDVQTVEWVKAAILDEATAPEGRMYASINIHDNALWVLGGVSETRVYQDVWALDLQYLQWELISCFPGLAYPQCRASGVVLDPPATQTLADFVYANPGVSESTYTVRLLSAPQHPVHVAPSVSSADAGHIQVSPAEIVFTERNWNVPQRVRVIVLEDLFLPGDSSDVSVKHTVRSKDAQYAALETSVRRVRVPSFCGDGRCSADESAHSCARDCRNVERAHNTRPFCGDGMCFEETHETCAEDCSVQGSDNSCPAERPVRCRAGACVAAGGVCALRARSTATVALRGGPVARLACASESETLCPDGTCAADATACGVLPPCPVGQRRCFDTSCRAQCGGDDHRCPPAVPNLLHERAALCVANPSAMVAVERANLRDASPYTTTIVTPHTQAEAPAHALLLGGNAESYYGQLSLPSPANYRAAPHADCPCAHPSARNGTTGDYDPLSSVTIEALTELPSGAFGGFCLNVSLSESGADVAAIVFAPQRASVSVAHERDADGYCLARRVTDLSTGAARWHCVDENVQTTAAASDNDAPSFSTRGTFSHASGCFAFVRDNCPGLPNADQADADLNGVGDACQEAVAACGPEDSKNANAQYMQAVFDSIQWEHPPTNGDE